MASVTELTKIVSTLISGTESGRLKWHPFEDTDELTASTQRFTYYIKSRDDDDRAPYRFQIFHGDDPGEAPMLVEYVSEAATAPELAVLMRRLYDLAKLNARGLGTSLSDEILKDLGG